MENLNDLDFMEYESPYIRLVDDADAFRDMELEKIIKQSLSEKTEAYEAIKSRLEFVKTDVYRLFLDAIKEHRHHVKYRALKRGLWWFTWKFFSDSEIKEMKELAVCISNLKSVLDHWLTLDLQKQGISKRGYDQSDIDEANAVPLMDIVGVEARIRAGRTTIVCPFHKEKTGSFVIYADNSWHCFGCGKHGNGAIDFIKARDGLGFVEAIKVLLRG